MEHLRGRTLADLISEGVRLDWRAALSIVVRIAEALHHAHSEGVVHRDLKPANIMLLPSGEPKILDFGIAKVETARTKLTTGRAVLRHARSTCRPSRPRAEEELGPRSDLFSLGAVAYNILTGHAAFAGDTIPAILHRVVEEEPLPPSHFVPELPPGVDAMIARASRQGPCSPLPGRREPGRGHQGDPGRTSAPRARDPRPARGPVRGLRPRARVRNPGQSRRERRVPAWASPPTPGGDLEEELQTLVSGLVPLPDDDAPRRRPRPRCRRALARRRRDGSSSVPSPWWRLSASWAPAPIFLWPTVRPARRRRAAAIAPLRAPPVGDPRAQRPDRGAEPTSLPPTSAAPRHRLRISPEGRAAQRLDRRQAEPRSGPRGPADQNLVGIRSTKGSLEKTLTRAAGPPRGARPGGLGGQREGGDAGRDLQGRLDPAVWRSVWGGSERTCPSNGSEDF